MDRSFSPRGRLLLVLIFAAGSTDVVGSLVAEP